MSIAARLTAFSVAAAGLMGAAQWDIAKAQGVVAERNISLALARSIADAALECRKGGQGISVAVVDRAGRVRLEMSGDGSPPHGMELARRKAYTARTFRQPSLEWAARSQTELIGQRSLAEVIPLGGGVPIKVGDETIGAVGVSGAGIQTDDDNCAKGAIAKIADQLK